MQASDLLAKVLAEGLVDEGDYRDLLRSARKVERHSDAGARLAGAFLVTSKYTVCQLCGWTDNPKAGHGDHNPAECPVATYIAEVSGGE